MWSVSYQGSCLLPNPQILSKGPVANVEGIASECVRAVRRDKTASKIVLLKLVDEQLSAHEQVSAEVYAKVARFVRPIGKLLAVRHATDSKLIKVHCLAVLYVHQDHVRGARNSQYFCDVYKCKSEDEASTIAQYLTQVIEGVSGRLRLRPTARWTALHSVPQKDLEAALAWWNSSTPTDLHLSVKAGVVVGAMRFHFQPSGKLATSVLVSLSSQDCGAILVEKVAAGFGIPAHEIGNLAIFQVELEMGPVPLGEDQSPLLAVLQWDDVSQAKFLLKPAHLVASPLGRLSESSVGSSTRISPAPSSRRASDATLSANAILAAKAAIAAKAHAVSIPEDEQQDSQQGSLGPTLVFNPEKDETLFRILVEQCVPEEFELTLAYVFRMCVAHMAEFEEDDVFLFLLRAMQAFLGEIQTFTRDMMAQVFWAANLTKLFELLQEDPLVHEILMRVDSPSINQALALCLRNIVLGANDNLEMPPLLASMAWNTVADLQQVILDHVEHHERLFSGAAPAITAVARRVEALVNNDGQPAVEEKAPVTAAAAPASPRLSHQHLIQQKIQQTVAENQSSSPTPGSPARSDASRDHLRAKADPLETEPISPRLRQKLLGARTSGLIRESVIGAEPSEGAQPASPASSRSGTASTQPSLASAETADNKPEGALPLPKLNSADLTVKPQLSEVSTFSEFMDEEPEDPFEVFCASGPISKPAYSAFAVMEGLSASGSTGSESPSSTDGHLSSDWVTLVDPNSDHRYFAHCVTQETSWTDPRDVVTNVTLSKGPKGLGLGLAPAKSIEEDKVLVGIFISTLLVGAAGHQHGGLKEGDELLELDGHSLIGVDREVVIAYLKQVAAGAEVRLLVAQARVPPVE
eukprot:m.828659 g.828659  ORF g.828659 m.828659 type:complete len:866 (+) comp59441_c0_seq4:77-2674(+)